ncbi:calcium-binding protein LPS1-beta isoform X2 [Magallana gigas]|uniref:EF-hand domain-containing protein n=3 Tax=Magallana gigas TaxID=29159 RepID=A0A8W8KWR7_MAGGI|nr:uncharacterized protein LOC105338611 isoform X2 [Crassostrea gigas]|eukprot:XP_011442112.1 PREDICTED: uncharacterized protein LOC105338611 isoform X2 [Crassostrea gigas]
MEKFVAFVCLLGFALSVVVDFRPYDHSAELLFNGSDFNHDGIFSRDELEQEFKKYDADGDGRVSRHEYTTYVTTTTPELHDFAHALYDDYDVTGDHHLDHVDYDQYYAKLDADVDGSVTRAEFVDYWVKLFQATEHLHGHGHHG